MYKTREELETLARLSTQELSRPCERCGQTEGKHSHDDFCPLPDDAPRLYSDTSTFEPVEDAKHTPLPWKIERIEYPGKNDVSFELVRTHHIPSDKSRYFPREICQTYMREIKSEQALIELDEANLALIVHRVNCYDALLSALEAALPQLRWANIHGSRCEELIEVTEKAIAQAGGGQ